MNKFSTYIKQQAEIAEKPAPSDILFQDGDYKVRSAEGWVYMDEPDMIIAMIYLAETAEIIFRYEYVPTYKTRDQKDHYITMLSGTMKPGEEPLTALFREVEEETGFKLRPNAEVFEVKKFFVSKGCRAKYHVYFVPVTTNDYEQVAIVGDGSDAEAKSQNIKVSIDHLHEVPVEDTITAFCIEFLKNYFR